MNIFIQLLVCISLAGCSGIDSDDPQIREVSYSDFFSPPKTRLSLSDNGVKQINVSERLVAKAVADGQQKNLNLVFKKAIYCKELDKFFYVFEIENHDDLFYIYVSDPDQANLISKFRFSDS